MANTRTIVALLGLLASATVEAKPVAQLQERGTRCNGDNLLNRFKDKRYSSAATSFCQTFINAYTTETVTVTTDAASIPTPISEITPSTVYPSPLLTTSYPETRLSSACNCISVPLSTKVTTSYVAAPTSTSTEVEPTTTSISEEVTTTSTDEATSTTEAATTTTTEEATTSTTDEATTSITDEATTSTTEEATTTTEEATSTIEEATTSTTEEATSTTEEATTTTEEATSTTEEATSTTEEATTSTTDEATTSTTEEATTTTEEATSTTEEATTSTTEEATTTSEEAITTTEEATSTTEEATSTTEEATSTTEEATTTTEEATTTTEEATSTTEEATSTTEEANTTTEEATSTTEEATSTTEEATSTTEEATSTTSEAATTTSAATIPTETSLGCWTEGQNDQHALSEKHWTVDMTVEQCRSICAGFNFYGVEYGNECYCGNEIKNGAFRTDDSACDIVCAGDHSEQCGGRSLLNLYRAPGSTATVPSAPTPTQTTYPYTSVGCFLEPSSGAKALTRVYSTSDMTREKCFYNCYNGGYKYAGLEYGQECWCGNQLTEGTARTDDAACNFKCAGDHSETCGASNKLQLYINGGVSRL